MLIVLAFVLQLPRSSLFSNNVERSICPSRSWTSAQYPHLQAIRQRCANQSKNGDKICWCMLIWDDMSWCNIGHQIYNCDHLRIAFLRLKSIGHIPYPLEDTLGSNMDYFCCLLHLEQDHVQKKTFQTHTEIQVWTDPGRKSSSHSLRTRNRKSIQDVLRQHKLINAVSHYVHWCSM